MSSVEPIWLKIVVIFVAAVTIGITIANLIYFNKLRNGSCKEISTGTATTMFWVNIVLLVLSIIIFLLAIWKIISPGKCPEEISTQPKGLPPGTTHIAYTSTGQFYDPSSVSATAVVTSPYLSGVVTKSGEASGLAEGQPYY
jgi:NADH:ubiquinone oxidoreductase subunit 5 (subunit L)/multisubunit Na+/H+ antiporter MnhA subunit